MGRLSNVAKAAMPVLTKEQRYLQDLEKSVDNQKQLLGRYLSSREIEQVRNPSDDGIHAILANKLMDRSYKGKRLLKADVNKIAHELIFEMRARDRLYQTYLSYRDRQMMIPHRRTTTPENHYHA